MKYILILTIFIFLLSGKAGSQVTTGRTIPRVVIGIVVENMRPDYFDRFHDRLGNEGFRKMYSEGLQCTCFRLDQLVQNNASGTATLFSGATPSVHGIIDHSWFDRAKGIERDCVSDGQYTLVGCDSKTHGASPNQLLCTTLPDQLKLFTLGKSRVFSVAMNKEPAILSCGFSGDAAFWFDEISGNMVSSSYYIKQLPEWAVAFNRQKPAQSALSRNWALLNPLSEYKECQADNDSIETGFGPGLNVFPYNPGELVKKAGDFSPLKCIPFANSTVKSFVISLLEGEKIGDDDYPDLVTLFFSSMDQSLGSFGPASMEMEDLYLRMDQEIAEILQFIGKKYGKDNALVFLTSNASASYPVKFLREKFKIPAGNFSSESAHALMNTYLNLTFGDLRWIDLVDRSQVYLNHKFAELNKVNQGDLRKKAADFLSQFEGVKIAVTSDQIKQNQLPEDLMVTIGQSYSEKRSGDVLYILQEGWQPVNKNKTVLYSDQQFLPLVFFGNGIKPGKDHTPYKATDLAPTLSEIMGIPQPGQSKGRMIGGVKNSDKP
jgi:hypothetical protein